MKKIIMMMAIFAMGFQRINAQNKHFEGEIIYSTAVSLNKTARKLIKGTEGEYKTKTVFKNGNEKSQENYFGTITYLFREKDSLYNYSPLTKKGYKCTYSASIADYRNIRKKEDSSVKPTGETKEVHGIVFEHFKGQDISKLDMLGTTLTFTDDIDYWVCRDYDENWITSIEIPGLYESFGLRSSGKIPIMGTFEQSVELIIEDFSQREVKDEEFTLPAEIIFEEVETSAKMESCIKRDYKNYKKAQGKQHGEDVKQEGAAKIKGDWDF